MYLQRLLVPDITAIKEAGKKIHLAFEATQEAKLAAEIAVLNLIKARPSANVATSQQAAAEAVEAALEKATKKISLAVEVLAKVNVAGEGLVAEAPQALEWKRALANASTKAVEAETKAKESIKEAAEEDAKAALEKVYLAVNVAEEVIIDALKVIEARPAANVIEVLKIYQVRGVLKDLIRGRCEAGL
jgi:hypothetical protein